MRLTWSKFFAKKALKSQSREKRDVVKKRNIIVIKACSGTTLVKKKEMI
jgi:hypothetical protein